MAAERSSPGTIYSPLPQSMSDVDSTYDEEEEEELNSVALGNEGGNHPQKTPNIHGGKSVTEGKNAHHHGMEMQNGRQPLQPVSRPVRSTVASPKTIEVEDTHKEVSPKVLHNKLRIAASTGDITTVKETIEKKMVAVDQVLQNGWSAAMFAAAAGQHEALEFLLAKGANPNFHKENFTALMAACASSSAKSEVLLAKCVSALLYHGANKNVVTRHGMSALMFACKEGHLEAAKLLMDDGVGLNLQDSQGWTALFWAVKKNHLAIAETLVAAGADVHICDKSGKVAFGITSDERENKLTSSDSPVRSGESEETIHDFKLLVYLLSGMNQLSLLPKLRAHNITAEKLLSITDADLEKIGITDCLQRVCMHIAISKFHAMEWSKKSLVGNIGNAFRPQDAIVVLENMLIHLKTMSATVKYVRHAVEGKRVAIPVNTVSEQNLLLEKSEGVMQQLDLVRKDVTFLRQNLMKMQGLEEVPADFISQKKITNRSSKFVSLLVMSAVLGVLAWKSRPLLIK